MKKYNTLKIPPHSDEAEMALLGSIMISPESIHEVSDIIRAQTFYSEKHSIVYETMTELHAKASPIDLVSVSQRLKEKEQLDRIGGVSYITELVNSVPTSTNILHYAELVFKKSMLRKLIASGEYIESIGYEEDRELDDVLDDASKKIFEATNTSGSQKYVHLAEELDKAWERLDKMHKEKGVLRGVPTGFKELDKKLSGLQNSDLIILAARPSVGKTSLALNIACNAAIRHNVGTAIFSLEMSSAQLVDRMLSAESKVDAWKLRTGGLRLEEEFAKIRDTLDPLSKAPIYIDDQAGNNILRMRSVARRIKMEKGLGLIIVDYLQLMSPTSTKNSDNMVQQVTEISRSLKQLAKELDVPVLALSQLSRAVEARGGKPRLSDLRDSGSIEQDADVVIFIHRDDKGKDEAEKTNIAEIMIEKHRNGPTGTVKLYFDGDKTTFLDIDESQYGGMGQDVNSF
ncbi:MAG: replicative DNA helicase [bacterium]